MKKTIVLLLFIALLIIIGCNSAAPIPATPTSAPKSDCSATTPPDFMNYATWTKVNSKPIPGHETFVNIYVDNAAKDIYLPASGKTFPVCARIVKEHLLPYYSDKQTVTAITVMVKMPAGYDPEHNDWYWGMYDKDGKVAQMSGKVDVCIACHQAAAAADYVFSQKVLEESNK